MLKLYPDRLQIDVTEREAFALWQKDGKVSVIAADGTVVEPYVAPRFARLPLVVGHGAETKAKEFLALLDRYPLMRDQVRAAMLVAERRWNLQAEERHRRAPAGNRRRAGARHAGRSSTARRSCCRATSPSIDLRLPTGSTVRLSDEAAAAREEALKDKKPRRREATHELSHTASPPR